MKMSVWLSDFGPLDLIVNGISLVYCNWHEPDCMKKLTDIQKLFSPFPATYIESEIIEETKRELNEYFNLRRKNFHISLNLIGSPFQKKVWNVINGIPYGQTCSYKDIAIKIDSPSAVRAVANACGKNPLAVVIPCHRVIRDNGKMGGYTGGLEKKRLLIDLEKHGKGYSFIF